MSIEEIAAKVRRGEIRAREQVERAIALATSHEAYHAILALTTERAYQRAEEIDQQVAEGHFEGRLAGIPFVVKDNFLAFGAPTPIPTICFSVQCFSMRTDNFSAKASMKSSTSGYSTVFKFPFAKIIPR